MDEMEFDKTRKAIKANDLDDHSRRDMMDKLTSAGGQVLREKSLHEDEPSGRSRRKGVEAGGPGSRLPSELYKEKLRQEGEIKSIARQQRQRELKAATNFFARWSIKISCRLAGLVPMTRRVVLPPFLSYLNLEGKQALMECKLIANDILGSSPETARKIVQRLDEIQPLYVELIERGSKLYDSVELHELLAAYNVVPDEPVSLDSLRSPIISLLRKIYYMKSYQETYLTAVSAGLDLLQSIEKKEDANHIAKKKKLATDWKRLMNNVYSNLFLLLQRLEMKKMTPGGWLFEQALEIVEDERLGYRRKGDPVGKVKEEKPVEKSGAQAEESGEEEPTQTEEEEEPESPLRKHGLELMRGTPLAKLRKKHDPEGEYKTVADNDKVLLTYLFFKEFEREYSFLLTTKRIDIAAGLDRSKDTDYVRRTAETFDQLRRCHDLFRQYEHQNKEYQYAINETGPTVENYVEHARQVQRLEGRRGATGAQLRTLVNEIMTEISSIYTVFLQDIDGSRKLIQNADDKLSFNQQIEGARRLNNKSVKEAIFEACSYATVLSDRLTSGDLYGGVIEMGEADFARAFLIQNEHDALETPESTEEQ